MSWSSIFSWPDYLKTRACRQLIHHYLGAFFQEKLSLDQLYVDLSSGHGVVKDIALNLNALNESLSNNNIPFEIVKAYVGEINLSIPWGKLLSANSRLDIKHLEITIRPKQTHDQNQSDTSFELSTMFDSMSTSMSIAHECLKNDIEENNEFEGLDTFAKTINSILARVCITLTDTVIRLEHLTGNDGRGVALEVRIKQFEFFDSEAISIQFPDTPDNSSILRPTVFTNKNFVLSGLSLYTDEFVIERDSTSMIESLTNHPNAESMMSSVMTNNSLTASTGCPQMFGYESYNPIFCLTISGKQDIRLKLKQSDNISGPKVEIEAHCGSVNCLLTPKQLHALIVLFSAYQKAALYSTSETNLYNTATKNNRPMTEADILRIRQSLEEEIRTKAQQYHAPQYENEYYHFSTFVDAPAAPANPAESMFMSLAGMSQSIDLESSYTSSRPDSASIASHRRSSPHRSATANPSKMEKTHLKDAAKRVLEENQSIISTKCRLQFNFISLCLLHQDIAHSQQLKEFACNYFESISTINTSGILDDKQISEHRLKYSQACLKDHLSLIGKPLIIDLAQQSVENCLSLDLDIRFTSVDLCECLQPENTNILPKSGHPMVFNRLLSFIRPIETNIDSFSSFQIPLNGIQPAIQISLMNFDINQNKNKKSNSSLSRRLAALRPFSDVNIRLASSQIDFDLSILDRIDLLINACQNNPSSSSGEATNSANDSLTILNVHSSNCTLQLRFPVADLQATNKRRPWWIQRVHKEILSFDLKQIDFQSDFDSDQTTALKITSKEIQVYYRNENNEQAHIAQLSSPNGETIKFTVNLNDLKDFYTKQFHPSTINETLYESIECRLPTGDNQLPIKNKNTVNDNRQVLEVADTQTIETFLLTCSEETKLNLNILIPYVQLYIPNKTFLETIYNRFVNHLFMWESSVPASKEMGSVNRLFEDSPASNHNFQTCRSLIHHFDSQSSDDEQTYSDEEEQGGITPKMNKRAANSLVLRLTVQDIRVAANAPSAEKITNEAPLNSSQIGEFGIHGQGLTLAIVDGYQGDPNLQYFCLLTHSALLQHNGHGTLVKPNTSLNEIFSRALPELLTRLPSSEAFLRYKNNETMIRAAFEIRSNGEREEGRQKLIRGAFTIEGALLHQRNTSEADLWINQLKELFDLTDDEVPGYIPSTTLMDWNLEFRHCAIHYRPMYHETKCFIAIDSLQLTNTFVKNSKTVLLEINLDDWAIYLSKQKRDRCTIDLLNDYICIISGGAFGVRVCVNDASEEAPMSEPVLDVRITCNMINIRTCADSGNALIELLKYMVSNGDSQAQSSEISRHSPVMKKKSLDPPLRMNTEQSSHDDVSDVISLIADASLDHPQPISSSLQQSTQSLREQTPSSSMISSRSSDHEGGPAFSASSYDDDEDEDADSLPRRTRQKTSSGDQKFDFEFIQPEIGMCRPPQNGLCEVHVLSETPIQIHENHFAKPLQRNDLLKAPPHLPVPNFRISVREISLNWRIYGGSDFAQPKPNDSHQKPIQLNINDSVRFTASTASSAPQERAGGRLCSPYENTPSSRHERGGPCRDLRTSMEFKINKARFQYEEYNEEEKYSQRIVFAIKEFEILDRLLSKSEIDKFLYLYTTEAAPKRTYADMFVLKVLTTKPEGYITKRASEEFEASDNSASASSEPLECEIKVSLQPLRINIDYDTLLFMQNFFVNLVVPPTNRETSAPIPVHIEPTGNNLSNEYSSSYESESSPSPSSHYACSPTAPLDCSPSADSSIFIKHFVFSPDCHIRIDFTGKFRSEQLLGSDASIKNVLVNLVVGLAQLAKVDIYLRRISHKKGIKGIDRLLEFLQNKCKNDICATDVIKGIVPLSSFSQLFTGIRDLFYLPIDQYFRDGRIMYGVHRGASSFTTSTTLALIELSSQVVRCAHFAALLCLELVSSSSGSNASLNSSATPQAIMARNHPPPNDLREGVSYAISAMRQGFNATSHQLKTEAKSGRRRIGVLGLVGGVLRQMPSAAIQPIVSTTQAVENVLAGARNHLNEDERNDDKKKYRSEY